MSAQVAPLALGPALRGLRLERKLTLEDVAEATGISRSFLSLVETGKNDITFGRLIKILDFYDVSVAELVPDRRGSDPVVVRAVGREPLHSSRQEGMEVFLLSPDTKRGFMPIMVVLAPGGRTVEHTRHEGEEFIHVIEGEIEIELGNPSDTQTLRLAVGDSAYYRSDVPHIFRNAARRTARYLAVVSPPTL